MTGLKQRLCLFTIVLTIFRCFGEPCKPGLTCLYFDDSVYLLSAKNLNWDQSVKFCQGLHGSLPIPKNKFQMDFLSQKIDWNSFKVNRYWIGLKSNETHWIWNDNSLLSFDNWNINRPFPIIKGLTECVYVNVDRNHKWENVMCVDKTDITVVCHLEKHGWTNWSEWSDCDCNKYIQTRKRTCGTSKKARKICNCPGSAIEKNICSCMSKWKRFRKDNSSRKRSFALIKRYKAESLLVCSMFCLQEKTCWRFNFPGENICDLFRDVSNGFISMTKDDIANAYVLEDEGQFLTPVGQWI